MEDNKHQNNNSKNESEDKKMNEAGKIKGKIEVADLRERRDGPGGN